MSSLSNINNNSSVVNVGRTTPVTPGQKTADQSIPVVLASDQPSIPVEEQNKVQSEVALSLLGIPRSEVALGIFADVNTYDVNPTEWSYSPEIYTTDNNAGFGIQHLPEESGAIVEAPKNKTSVLTSKRFFRYQPGRVSSATFGVKTTIDSANFDDGPVYDLNPSIRKYGIFDKFDGYYWETRSTGEGDNFGVVRRTQSLLKSNPVVFGVGQGQQIDDYGFCGKAPDDPTQDPNEYGRATDLLLANRYQIVDAAYANTSVDTSGYTDTQDIKCKRDLDFMLDAYINDLQYGGNGHVYVNLTTYDIAVLSNPADESATHQSLIDEIQAVLTAQGETDASSKIGTLGGTVTGFFDAANRESYLDGITQNYGNRSKIETIFSIYKRYIGYIASEYNGNTAISYDTSNTTLSEEQLKYKCLRDISYVLDGYSRDLVGGGNAATAYNAKRYYFGGELKVYSQATGGVVAEIERHEYIKDLLTANTVVDVGPSKTIDSVSDRFNLSNAERTKLGELSDIIINNFTTPFTENVEFGTEGQFGDLVTLRDGLLMIHAAVYDPSLLKAEREVSFKATANTEYANSEIDGTLEVSEGEFVEGQFVRATTAVAGLTANKLYKVKEVLGPKSNIIRIEDPDNGTEVYPTGSTYGKLVPNIPFIFPDEYLASNNSVDTTGMFPYLYIGSGSLPSTSVEDTTTGFIDTALLDPNNRDLDTLVDQIDTVNLLYNNWVKQNVDPRYYSVYEYRVPRSRFSTDQLNGNLTNPLLYSDKSNIQGTTVYPGQRVTVDNEAQDSTSVWNLEFDKVTMYKIEFSWYGAVGALFLAYVPVGNGEARWVRVHHLRASNQLKISSLGNATLPITYVTYGGGDRLNQGLDLTPSTGYNSTSHHVVKYGASYYIDGGDRGTVRLYSHSNEVPSEVFGSRYENIDATANTDVNLNLEYLDVANTNSIPDTTYFMNARVVTNNVGDQNVRVVWVTSDRLYLNKSLQGTTYDLIADRPTVIFGLNAKETIQNREGKGVRNRVQVYPTKLSTANLGNTPVKVSLLKTPLFQPNTNPVGTLYLSSDYILSPIETPLNVTESDTYLKEGEFLYGWFLGRTPTNQIISIFGKLYKQNDNYYFDNFDSFNTTITLISGSSEYTFLPEKRFSYDAELLGINDTSLSVEEKERLSSVQVATQIQSPIPATGTEVVSFYTQPGSNQYDLLSFFDYNKDYISFPLTDEVESLYITSNSTKPNANTTIADINASLTWEEQ